MIERYIEFVMDDIGCPKHLKGYNQLHTIIKRQIKHPAENICTSYKMVASECDTTRSKIERNIRHLVIWMLDNCDRSKIYNYFGNSLPISGVITNKQFIITLATAAKRMSKEEENVEHRR